MPRADARRGPVVLVALLALVLGACSGGEEPAATPSEPAPPPVVAEDPPAVEDEGGDGPRVVDEPAEPVTPVPTSRAALAGHLETVVDAALAADPALVLGVLVVDEAGREVAAHEPDTPLLPASTLKQVTAAAALTTLGPQARLRTVVDATAGIDGDGRLDGDLVLIGSGDPTLVTEEYRRFIYPARPSTSLASLADQLVDAGLTRVAGDVRGIAPRFAAPSLPVGWRDAYLDALDGRYVSGLTVDGGLRTLIELPEVEDDEEDAEHVGTDGETDAEEADEQEADEQEGPPVSILDQLAALDTDLAPTVRVDLATDPSLHAAAELTRLLRERGVGIDGVPTVEPGEQPVVARLASVASPPLEDVLRFTVQRSDNHLADAIALTVARTRTGEGTWESTDRALGQVLARFGVPTEGARFADGSGLSREDRITPRQLVELDRRLTGDPRFGGTWRSLQAAPGRSGTLERRLVGTPAAGRLLAKTGTLRDVAGLSGQVIAADADPEAAAGATERRYHLAVLGNEASGVGRGVVRALVDEVVLALVADLDGCELVAGAADDGPLGAPPSTVRCQGGAPQG